MSISLFSEVCTHLIVSVGILIPSFFLMIETLKKAKGSLEELRASGVILIYLTFLVSLGQTIKYVTILLGGA